MCKFAKGCYSRAIPSLDVTQSAQTTIPPNRHRASQWRDRVVGYIYAYVICGCAVYMCVYVFIYIYIYIAVSKKCLIEFFYHI